MTALIVHFASGQAFFSGAAMILLAAWLGLRDRRGWAIVAGILGLTGVIFIALSTTPLPMWFYLPAAILTIAWLILFRRTAIPRDRRKRLALVAAGVWVLGVLLELPWQFVPEIEPLARSQTLTIFGDSVTAGQGQGETTWPQMLAESVDQPILDESFPGATTATALKRAKDVDVPPGIVFIELGGNDILGADDPTEYAQNLDALLALLAKPGRELVMLELPLPPFHYRFGWIQRALAKKYNVRLIPKRILLSVLLSDKTTVDTIHLSPEGHRRMAATIHRLLFPPPNKN